MSTSILIRRLTGTGKGKEETLVTQEVSFGTGPHNTVRYDPTWDRGVAAAHARVWQDEAGMWWLQDAGSSTGTFVNGQRITVKRQVGGPTVIELGQNGPKVEIVLPPAVGGGAAQRPTARTGAASSGGAGKWLAIAAAVALIGAGSWVFLQNGASDERFETVARRLEGAVGKVLVFDADGNGITGTAWAVASGIFATNGHIATPAAIALREGGSVFIALNKQPEKKYRVIKAISHPDYNKPLKNSQGKDSTAGTYDVGLLIVKESCPVTFPLASAEKINRLDAGRRVAFIGFPAEGLLNHGSDNNLPVATMQTGIVTAVTDLWGNQADAQSRLLVQHSLPCTGGASGSPIFDADGDVIAVLNAGNLTYSLSLNRKAMFDEYRRSAMDSLFNIMAKLLKEEGEELTNEGIQKIGQDLAEDLKKKQKEIEAIKIALPVLKQNGDAIKQADEILQDLAERLKAAKPSLSDAEKNQMRMEAMARYTQLLEIKLGISETTRTPSAALINFGMRADVLQELLTTYQKGAETEK